MTDTKTGKKQEFRRPAIRGRSKIFRATVDEMKEFLYKDSNPPPLCKVRVLFYDLNSFRSYNQSIKKFHMELLDSQVKHSMGDLSFLSTYNFYNFSSGMYDHKSDVSGSHIVSNGFEIYYMKPGKPNI